MWLFQVLSAKRAIMRNGQGKGLIIALSHVDLPAVRLREQLDSRAKVITDLQVKMQGSNETNILVSTQWQRLLLLTVIGQSEMYKIKTTRELVWFNCERKGTHIISAD